MKKAKLQSVVSPDVEVVEVEDNQVRLIGWGEVRIKCREHEVDAYAEELRKNGYCWSLRKDLETGMHTFEVWVKANLIKAHVEAQ